MMTDTNRDEKTVQRRRFLLTLGASGATAAAAATVSSPPAEAMVPPDGKGGPHYRESEHIKEYYRVNRY
jgi:hypothetical protein